MINYTTTDGIPGSEVFDIIQDDRGYIWLATNNGICKFNGIDFKAYHKKDGLPDNSVIEFYNDSQGKIWIIPYNNELSYLKGDSIYLYKYNDVLKDFKYRPDYCITSFAVKKDFVFIGWKHRGIIEIDQRGKIDTISYFPKSKPASCFYKLSEDEMIFSYNNPYALGYKSEIKEKDTSFYINPFYKDSVETTTRYECVIFDGNVAISFGKHLFLINKYRIKEHKIFDSEITKMRKDNNGGLLVCTYNNGVYFFPHFKINNDNELNILKKKTVTSIFQDNIDGYWISTLNYGIYYIPSLDFSVINKEDGLKENFVNNITNGDDELWFSTIHNYVGYINNKEIKQFDLFEINTFNVTDIKFDVSENVLWGCFEGGFHSLFSLNKDTFNSYANILYLENKTIENFNVAITSILQKNKFLYLGSPNGIDYKKKKGLEHVSNLIKTPVYTMDFGKTNNEIWFGNRDGLFYYKNDSVTYFGDRDKLFVKRIVELQFEKTNNQLWVATKDSGIYVLRNDSVRHITKNEGLSGNNITALYVKNNVIWVGTTKGVDQITITDLDKFIFEIQHFNENKGLVSNIINDIAVIEPNVYIATDKGISFFNYKNVRKNNISPPIYYTSVKINNKDTVLQDSYSLSHDLNNIEINYDGLSYNAPKEVTYQYQLDGLHRENKITSSNTLEFLLLPPGNYLLKLYAVNEDGTRSKEPKEIQFFIRPPFYKTWWFISLLVLVLIFIIGSFFRIMNILKSREVRKRNLVEKNLIQERQKALGQQMNPHFIFNTLSSIQNYLYKKDNISSSVYLEKFSQLMRDNLINSQEDFITLNNELKSLKTYIELEQLRLDNMFEFKINIDEDIDVFAVKIPAFLIQPYVENSVWHGLNQKKEKGLIEIDFNLLDDYIICTIKDNGIGRKASSEINKRKRKSHISLGGKITEKRLDLFNSLYKKKLSVTYKDLINNNGNASGTKVEITLPIFN